MLFAVENDEIDRDSEEEIETSGTNQSERVQQTDGSGSEAEFQIDQNHKTLKVDRTLN